ncbi:MAG: DNA polymerase III subunit delta [Planctomycetes bacterium]|nr:DNA polymerase III subunit delta [Planctomycetota bacterium]
MSPEEFQRGFRQAPIYVLAGDEDFFKLEAIARIRSGILPQGQESIGLLEFEGDETDMATVLDELRTRTLFGGDRVVILQRADRFFGLPDRGGSAGEEGTSDPSAGKSDPKLRRELLLQYLEAPAEGASFVVTTQRAWAILRKLSARIAQVGFMVECQRPFESRIAPWLHERARHYGKKLVGRAAQQLARHGGENLLQLDSQLAKLATYAGERAEITEANVEDLVGRAGHHKIFALTEAAASKNARRALEVLRDLLHYGQTEPALISMLAWHFRRLWQAKKMQAAGVQPPEITKELRLHPYFAADFMKQLNLFSDAELRRNHRFLLEADVACKSAGNPQVAVEMLVLDLCRK